jgi:hypothetical protein
MTKAYRFFDDDGKRREAESEEDFLNRRSTELRKNY